MGKAGKWLRSLLLGKKEKEKEERNVSQVSALPLAETRSGPISVPAAKEKRRWSFRRSMAASVAKKDPNSPDSITPASVHGLSEAGMDQKRHAMAVAVATAAAAEAAVAAAQAAATVIRLTTRAANRSSAIEDFAAVKIQATFRAHLARKALCALRGLVKLQALVRGHLVRKQASATLRCMQALVTVQSKARAQRLRMIEESQINSQRPPTHRRSPKHPRSRHSSFERDRNAEEKIVEMDLGVSRGSTKSRNSYSAVASAAERRDHRFFEYYGGDREHCKTDVSPATSNYTDISPRGQSARLDEFSFATALNSPHEYLSAVSVSEASKSSFSIISRQDDDCYSVSHDYPLYPNYMAYTQSSRAKSRSQSAPKQRPEAWERPPSRRGPPVEGRSIPKSLRMQRSSSNITALAGGYQFPWSMKLAKSTTSLKDSECGSTSTVLTNTNNYCGSLIAYEAGTWN